MKIVGTDFDGTLCMPHEPIPQENIDAIKRWQAAGNKFGIVSGRNYDLLVGTLDEYADSIQLDYFVCNNGCTVYDKDKKAIYAHKIPTELYHSLWQHPSVLISPYVFIETMYKTYVYERYPGAMSELGVALPPLTFVPEEEALKLQDVVMLSVLCPSREMAASCAKAIDDDYNCEVVGIYNRNFLDILMGGNNKRTGIEHAVKALGWQDATVFTVGDDINDVAMIAGFEGCALPWSQPAVHAAAKHEYASVADIMNSNI